MLSNRAKRTIIVFFGLIGICAVTPNTSIAYTEMEHIRERYSALAQMLISDQDKVTNALLDNWAKYLKDVARFSQEDFGKAINELQTDYYAGINSLEKCILKEKKYRENYSSVWLKDLSDHFGKEFVQRNETAILVSIAALEANSTKSNCGNEVERLICQEAVLYEGYRYYLKLFSDFYNGLNQKGQKKLQSRKEAANDFIALLNRNSVAAIIFGGITGKRAEIEAKKLNKRVFFFLKSHPSARTLDLMKAKEDLFKITRTKSSAD